MKHYILTTLILTAFLLTYQKCIAQYDTEYAQITFPDEYTMVTLKRDGDRVKAKYFAAEDYNGNSVYERYEKWSAGRKTILVTSGTYMDNCNHYYNPKPVGICIDNGVVVNNMLSDKFDGLVIVYATGGIVVSDLNQGDLSIRLGNGEYKTLNIRANFYDRLQFIKWAEDVEATVFQTHLLVYKNALQVYLPTSTDVNTIRERRFLAGCKDEFGNIIHTIIHSPSHTTLYEGARRVKEFLIEFKEMEEVVFMINLDTGCQDVFQVNNPDGRTNPDIRGNAPISQAVNLLAYYFE